jgi:hypothetical protein
LRKPDRWASISRLEPDALPEARIETAGCLVILKALVLQYAHMQIGAKTASGYCL